MLVLLQNAVFAAAFLAVALLLGFALLSFIGWKQTMLGSVAWGFVVLLAVFHAAAYPLYLRQSSFSLLFYIYSGVLLALLAVSLVIAVRRKLWSMISGELRSLRDGFKKTPLPYLVLAGMLLLMLYFNLFYYSWTSDDCYYMPRAMEILSQNALGLHHSVGWYGMEIKAFPDSIDASTLEMFKAYLSRVSGIQVTLLCRNGFEIALLAVCVCCAWTFMDVFTKDKEHASSIRVYALICYIAIIMLDICTNTNGNWIMRYLWQGKAMLPGMVFPLLFASCGRIMQHIDDFKYREWLPVLLTLVTGVCVTIVGVFLVPILFFLIGAAFLIVTRFRHFWRILPCAVVCALPLIATAAISYLRIQTGQTAYDAQTFPAGYESWIGQLEYSTNKAVFLLFLACAIYVFFRGSRLEKALFAAMPTLLLVSFLNPLFMQFVSSRVTTASVYWRLFWLMPTLLLPAYVIPDLLLRRTDPRQLQKYLLTACSVVCLLSASAWSRLDQQGVIETLIPMSQFITTRDNPYRVAEDSLQVAEHVLADWKGEGRPLLLSFDEDHQNNEVRQLTCEICIAAGVRENQVTYLQDLIPGTQIRECDFYNTYQTIEDGEYLHDLLTRQGIDYVCFYDEPACQHPEDCGFTLLYNGERTLWRVDTIHTDSE